MTKGWGSPYSLKCSVGEIYWIKCAKLLQESGNRCGKHSVLMPNLHFNLPDNDTRRMYTYGHMYASTNMCEHICSGGKPKQRLRDSPVSFGEHPTSSHFILCFWKRTVIIYLERRRQIRDWTFKKMNAVDSVSKCLNQNTLDKTPKCWRKTNKCSSVWHILT